MKFLNPLGLLLGCGISSGLFAGCAWSIGDGDGKPHTVSTQPTRGQELIDLKRARDQGAITSSEYETKKQQILEK